MKKDKVFETCKIQTRHTYLLTYLHPSLLDTYLILTHLLAYLLPSLLDTYLIHTHLLNYLLYLLTY